MESLEVTESSPVAIPWYKSDIMRGIVTGVVAQLIAKLQAKFHLDLAAWGLSDGTIVTIVMDGITALAIAYTARARLTQKSAPSITLTAKKAETINSNRGAP